MANRGFIKDVGGSKRMRFVRPGYDANNMSVPPNQVVFDSDNIGALSIHASGVVDVTTPIDGFIATWPNLGYVPLTTVQFMIHPSSPSPGVDLMLVAGQWHFSFSGDLFGLSPLRVGPGNEGPRVYSYPTGLFMKLYANTGDDRVYRLYVKYNVFRSAV